MLRRVALLATTLTLLAACGGSGGGAPGDGVAGVTVSGEPGKKPELELPGGEPPTELLSQDIIVGEGPVVEEGATVTTHYVGKAWSTKEVFDASWGGEPVQFGLDQVIAGWTQGIPGMRVGGRRLLVIPPDLAYGEQSPTPAIKPGETLVFVIDVVATS